MNRKYLCFAIAITLAVGIVACGKSEEKPATPAPAASAPAASAVDPATAATVTGSVKLDGPAPKNKAINMGAEPSCAAKHATKPMTEEVVADAGALANVVVYVKDGLGGKTFPARTETVILDQAGCQYTPHVVAVQTNQPIEVKNSDPTTHNIHPTPANNREWNESQAQGTPALQKSFAREEIAIPVKCNVHPWMKSYIAVFSHPYFNVTGKGGTFELKNLPPGDYTLVAWHEKLGTQEQKVTVAAKESKAVTFTFKAPTGD